MMLFPVQKLQGPATFWDPSEVWEHIQGQISVFLEGREEFLFGHFLDRLDQKKFLSARIATQNTYILAPKALFRNKFQGRKAAKYVVKLLFFQYHATSVDFLNIV